MNPLFSLYQADISALVGREVTVTRIDPSDVCGNIVHFSFPLAPYWVGHVKLNITGIMPDSDLVTALMNDIDLDAQKSFWKEVEGTVVNE